jgi:hypothetical protein
MLTAWTRNLFQAIGNIRLGPEIKIHVSVYREIIATLQADGAAFSIGLQRSSVDPEVIRFTDCTMYTGQPFFNFFE